MTFARSSRSLLRAASLGLALAFALADTGVSLAHEFKAGSLVIVHPWARATPPGAKVGGGYMVIENHGTEADRLVSATASVSPRVEVHEMAVVDGVMRMRPLPDGLEIPAGGSVELKPGSYHIMMMDLSGPLTEGENVAGSLSFEKAGSVDVSYKVEAIGSTQSDDGTSGHDMGGHDMGGHDAGGDMDGMQTESSGQ